MRTENGRSMVEMLGVLAIIGVLSVGGIAGYKTAMTKHKVNELLNESSKRAVAVAAQIAARQNPSIAEFSSNEFYGATFTGVTDNNDGTFSLNLTLDSGFDPEVCDKMKAAVGGDSAIRDWGTNCDTLTYNNDLSTTDPLPDPEEVEKQNCRKGLCVTCIQDPDGKKTEDFLPPGTECEIGGVKGTCNGVSSRCTPDESAEDCYGKNKCEPGYFCYYNVTHSPDKCLKAMPIQKTINGVDYYYNSASELKSWCRTDNSFKDCGWGYIPLWSAEDYCHAIGKSLLTKEEYQSVASELSQFLPKPQGGTYWVVGGRVNMSDGSNYNTGRQDGYFASAGVVCK